MSKHMRQFLFLLLAAILVSAGVLISSTFAVIPPQQARPPRKLAAPSAARNAAIVATTSAVLEETSEIRELPIRRPVKSGAQSRSDIERMLILNLNKDTTPAEMHASELTLKKLGLVPSTFELRPFIIKLLTEQVAGYYDPKTQQFHLADWIDAEGQKPVMAHELTHALQDQHFNLRRFEKWPHGDADAELAAHALIEGDAMLTMTLYMLKYPMVALALRRSLGPEVTSAEQFNAAPRVLRDSLMFPYLNGADFARHVYKRGGWAAVSKAYTNLPLSTEHILHPEKYFSYERPVRVALHDVANVLNAGHSSQQSAISNQQGGVRGQESRVGSQQAARPARAETTSVGTAGVLPASSRAGNSRQPIAHRPSTSAAWRLIDSNVNGEWSYYLQLDEFLKSTVESKRAAAGWAGDRYEVYEGPAPGDIFIAQLSVWDTENDAREFFEAYVKRTKLRYPDAKRADSSDPERDPGNSRAPTYKLLSWLTGEGKVVIQLRGSRVLVLEGIPEGVDENVLLNSLRQQ